MKRPISHTWKHAPFAASPMRTVLYSTFNNDDEYIFQGVARLVTHERPGAGTAQATGFLGGANSGSVRDKKKIPKKFLRTEKGMDLFVLGYQADQNWVADMIYSVLENFWPAIHYGELEVLVGGTKITKKNLPALLESYSSREDFTAHLYYQAFTDAEAKKFTKKLSTLKDVAVHLLAGNPDLPKKVAMVRKTGMVIYQKPFRSVLPFCGVFLCRNEEGNRILREMEPPRHDDWDADHPEQGAHKKTADEFSGYIRDCIKALAPVDNEKVLTIPELSQYLPDDDDSPEVSFEGNPDKGLSKNEGFDSKPESQEIHGRTMDHKPRVQPDSAAAGDGETDTEEGGDGESSGSDGDGGGDNGGDSGGGINGEAKRGRQDGKSPKPPIPVRYRVFPQDLATGAYSLTVQPQSRPAGATLLSVSAVGDDSSTPVAIASAKLVGGKKLEMPQPGKLGPVTFPPKGSLRIELILKEPQRLAMEVNAHEA